MARKARGPKTKVIFIVKSKIRSLPLMKKLLEDVVLYTSRIRCDCDQQMIKI